MVKEDWKFFVSLNTYWIYWVFIITIKKSKEKGKKLGKITL